MGACMSIDEDTMQIVCGPAKPTLRARRRMLTQMLDAESKVADILSKMPGRICGNGSTLSSCAYSKQGRKGVNQDCMLIWEEYAAQSDTVFCGIFDGHGRNGHLVAKKVRDSLPVLLALPVKLLAEEYNKIDKEDATTDEYKLEDDNDEDFESLAHDKTDKDTLCTLCNFNPAEDMAPMSKLSSEQWRVKLVGACRLMDRTLNVHPKIHCFESGTTALTMVVQGETIVIGNVGDSRAVLGKRLSDGSVVAEQLTTDLKPNLPRELERIKRHKGRVFALCDEPGVARIWLPDSDMPGLAMARALGDFCLKDYGLSSVPQVCVRRLAVEDQFIVLATDGVN
ncbi:hypothetical protein KP509_26G028800 [Ceratopteris richardii]|uniref:PPM-type phosphatase domain-containing protein n=1 Tax=Ceratopteris richardii TaxID=49495 RepID=A0A8T2RLZ7_CERRI|nr:hypothetical protein KP509_26G028800 [Ceratopteris richardii]